VSRQLGLLDERYRRLSEVGDPLTWLKELIDFEVFRPALAAASAASFFWRFTNGFTSRRSAESDGPRARKRALSGPSSGWSRRLPSHGCMAAAPGRFA